MKERAKLFSLSFTLNMFSERERKTYLLHSEHVKQVSLLMSFQHRSGFLASGDVTAPAVYRKGRGFQTHFRVPRTHSEVQRSLEELRMYGGLEGALPRLAFATLQLGRRFSEGRTPFRAGRCWPHRGQNIVAIVFAVFSSCCFHVFEHALTPASNP